MTVGERIKQLREDKGLSQDELAKIMGYASRQTVSKAECHGDNITTTKVAKYADALGVSFAYLMGWEDREEKEILDKGTFDGELINIILQLNDDNVQEVIKYASYLLSRQ